MQSSADPELLSLLEKVSNPVTALNVEVDVAGVFAPVELWKLTDETNPNVFTYSLQIFGKEIEKGRIQPRQLTEKEVREAEEAKAKKGGKKDSKVEDAKPSPEEEQEEARKKAHFESLSEQDRFYFRSEDPFQSPALKFEKPAISFALAGAEIDKFEAELQKPEIDVVLVRRPDINEEEIGKLKKAKPKGLNLGQLVKMTFKGALEVGELSRPGGKSVTARIKLLQVEEGLPADAPKFEMKDCYVYLTVKIDPPLVPLVESIKPEVSELFVAKPSPNLSSTDELVKKLKGEIIVAVRSISAEYANMFTKDKELQEEKKQQQASHYSQMKVTEVNKRKELFYSEFKSNGKYALFRARIEKVIKAICIDKLSKEKGLGKPKAEDLQRALSEVSVFLNQQIGATINDFLGKHPEQVHQDILLSHRVSREAQTQPIHAIVSEATEDRYIRVAAEYELINRLSEAEQNIQNLLLANPKNDAYVSMFVSFCLRHKKFEAAQCQLTQMVEAGNDSLENRTLLSILLLQRGRYNQSLALIKELIEDSRAATPQKIIYHQLASLICQRLNEKKQSERYKTMAEKLFKLKLGLPVKLDEQEDPYQQPKPRIPKPQKTVSLLTVEQAEDMHSGLLQLLADNNFLDLTQQEIHRISDSPKKTLWLTQAALFNERYAEALQHIEQLLQTNNKNYEWLLLKADICFLSQRLFECQQVFLKLIKLKPNGPKTFALYLRLGTIYLQRKAWQDARNIFLKACELKSNSSLSWLGLGRAHYNLNEISKAEQALNLANIYEPFNREVEPCLAEVRAAVHKGEISSEVSITA